MGCAIRRLVPDFNDYVGAGTLGGTSHLYQLVATRKLRSLVAEHTTARSTPPPLPRSDAPRSGRVVGRIARSACAVSEYLAVVGVGAKPAPLATSRRPRSASFERPVISCGWSGLPRPIRSAGGSSAGTAAVPPSRGSSSPERTGARPLADLRGCSSRSRSPFPASPRMVRCSGRKGYPICICGQVMSPGEREPPGNGERANGKAWPARKGGTPCHRSDQRRRRRQARQARRGSRSRKRRPRAGSNTATVHTSLDCSTRSSGTRPHASALSPNRHDAPTPAERRRRGRQVA